MWLKEEGVRGLIFDEYPYKEYDVVIADAPVIKYLCFDELRNEQKMRIYKGEGKIKFICYSMYAHNPSIKGHSIENYSDCDNLKFWAVDNKVPYSEVPFPFVAEFIASSSRDKYTVMYNNKEYNITNVIFPNDCDTIYWDSSIGAVYYIKNGIKKPLKYTGNGRIFLEPKSYEIPTVEAGDNIIYSFLYY